MPARSSRPSRAKPASRGKSSAGTWSPPCETSDAQRAGRTAARGRTLAAAPGCGEADVDERPGVAEHRERLRDRLAAGRRRRRRSRAADPLAGVRRAEAPRRLELPLVEVDRVDLGGAGDARALDRPRGRRRRSRSRRRARRARPAPSSAPSRRRSRPRSRSGSACSAGSPSSSGTARTAVHDRPRRERAEARARRQRSRAVGEPQAASAVAGVRQRCRRAALAPARTRRTASASRARRGRPARRARRPARPPRRRRRPRGRAAPGAGAPSRSRRRAGRCGRRRSPRCGRAPRPAPGSSSSISSTREAAGLGQDDAAIHVRVEVAGGGAAPISASVRSVSAISCLITASTPSCPPTASAYAYGRPSSTASAPSASAFSDVGAACGCRRPSARSRRRRAPRAPRRARRARRPRRRPGGRRGSRRSMPSTPCSRARSASSPVSTPLTRSGSVGLLAQPVEVVPGQRRGSGTSPSIAAAAVSMSSSGGCVEPAAEDGVGEELRAALAGDERQVGVAQVARPPAERSACRA